MNKFNFKFSTSKDNKRDCKKLIQFQNMFKKRKASKQRILTQFNNIQPKKKKERFNHKSQIFKKMK